MAVRGRGLFREIISLCGSYNIIIIIYRIHTYTLLFTYTGVVHCPHTPENLHLPYTTYL